MATATVDLSFFPSPIAIPVEKSRLGDPQRKDLLRFAFENAMGILGCVLVGDLLDNLDASNADDGDDGLRSQIMDDQAEDVLKKLRNIGMEQLSLGKWANLTRTLGDCLGDLKGYKPNAKEALKAYELAKQPIDSLVSIRNQDAHGQPIPTEKLDAELDRREALLMEVLAAMQFLQQWRLVRLDRFEISSGQQVYYGTEYSGQGSAAFEEALAVDQVPLGEPVLIGRKDPTRQIRLMPLAIVAPIDGQNDTHFAIFSKEIKGDADHLHYLSARGTSDINVSMWTDAEGPTLDERRSLFQLLFKEPEILAPQIDATLTITDTRLRVGDEDTGMELVVRNHKGSPRLESLATTITLPPMITMASDPIIEPAEDGTSRGCTWDRDEAGRRLTLQLDQLPSGETWKAAIPIAAMQQGSAAIPPAVLDFRYPRHEDDENADGDATEAITGPTILVTDPNAADPMCPIINVKRNIQHADAEIRIGDRFEYQVTLENIGLGAARDVQTHVIIPDGLNTLDGPEEVRVHLLPGQSRTFRWSLRAEKPGIYQARICDVVYLDLADRRFATECSEEFRFLVRSDKRRELRFKLKEIVSDLQITDDELAELERLQDSIADTMPDAVQRQQFVHEACSDAIVEVARAAVADTAASRGIPLREDMFTETKWQAKDHPDRGQRTMVAFAAAGMPFFAIDITDAATGVLSFHSFDIPGGARAPFDTPDEGAGNSHGVYARKSKTNGPLTVSMPWTTLSSMGKPGLSFLKGWIGRCMTRIEREILPWRSAAETFARAMGGKAVYRWQRFELVVPDEIKNDLCIQDIADPSGSYKCCGWCYRSPTGKNAYDLIVNLQAGARGMSKQGVKWIQKCMADGRFEGLQFYKSFAKKAGGPEPTDGDSYWLGMTVDWCDAEDDSAIHTAAERLTSAARSAYVRDLHKSPAATWFKSTIDPLKVDENGCNWLSGHADRLYEAGVGFRTACTTSQLIRDTIELFKLSDPPGSGGPPTALGRIHAGKGKGELWLNWYAGMDEALPVAAHLNPDEAVWPSSDKVPDAVRFGLWLRIAPDDVDQASFDDWIDGVIAAAGCSGPATWPRFAMPRLYALTLQCNSMLPEMTSVLHAKTLMTKEDLRMALGGDSAARNAINRLLYWQSRYMRLSPLRTGHGGLIELDPTINCPVNTLAAVDAENDS